MIVKMKKATILVQDKDAKEATAKLRKLGLLHIEHQAVPEGKELNLLQEELALISEAETILSMPEFGNDAVTYKQLEGDWKITAKHVIDIYKRIDHLKEYSRRLISQIEEWQVWGDFEPQTIKDLALSGVFIKLYQIPARELKEITRNLTVVHIKTLKGVAYVATVSFTNTEIGFKELALPNISISRLKARLAEDAQVLAGLIKELNSLAAYKQSFLKIKISLSKEFELESALKGMGRESSIMFLTGYLPYDKTNILLNAAKANSWAIFVRDPDESDNVPTLISNPRWISIINPVFKFIEIVPGYGELDISLWFLIFFSIFFGMLIGDAGVGAIFALLTFAAQKKLGRKVKNRQIFVLFYILSACAIVWGVASGTIFGQEWLRGFVKPVFPALQNEKFVQSLCFLLGAIHLSIAHAWRAILKAPALKALSDIGWILILWGGFFLAKTLVLAEAFPDSGKWLLLSGIILVIGFSEPNKNILKAISKGLAAFALSAVNSFTDIVSYVRLFAVGLASVAVADAFNNMAMGLWGNGLIAVFLGAFILFIGQALNVILGPIAVLVHGVRLNVLEFCSHLDIKWAGFRYKPLEE
jgi:V/A-type H+-transporting ATPase subunit I